MSEGMPATSAPPMPTPEVFAGAETSPPTLEVKTPDSGPKGIAPEASGEATQEQLKDVRNRLGMRTDFQESAQEAPKAKLKSAEELYSMDYYARLGLPPNASLEEIKASRKSTMGYHPDQGGDTASMQAINEAYESLSDPEKRTVYDETPRHSANGTQESASGGSPEGTRHESMEGLQDVMSQIFGKSPIQQKVFYEEKKKRRTEERKSMIRDKLSVQIAELQSRDSEEFITIKAPFNLEGFNRETTVGEHLSVLSTYMSRLEREELDIYKLNNLEKLEWVKISYRGTSKVNAFFRKVF